MDLFFAGSSMPEADELIQNNLYNRLFSYLNDKTNIENYINYMKQNNVHLKLFIDSGAFTAWTKGTVIDVDTYINWLNERADYLYLYGQLDSIPGNIHTGATAEQVKEAAKQTWENYLYMRSKLKNPNALLYTFHVGEPYEYLQQALEWVDEIGNHIPYIALEGMVGKTTQIKDNFLQECFKIIKNSSNPNVKIHAFGMTSFKLLSIYPITSADSTSWIMTGANGSIMSDIGIIHVSENGKNCFNHFSHLDKKYQDYIDKLISKYGYTLQELSKDYKKRELLNIKWMWDKSTNLVYKPTLINNKLF